MNKTKLRPFIIIFPGMEEETLNKIGFSSIGDKLHSSSFRIKLSLLPISFFAFSSLILISLSLSSFDSGIKSHCNLIEDT